MQIFMGGRGNGKSTEQIIVAISEGNPGCIQFCCIVSYNGNASHSYCTSDFRVPLCFRITE